MPDTVMTPEQTACLDRVKRDLPAELGATDFEVRLKATVAHVDFSTTSPDASWSFDIDARGAVPTDGRAACTHSTLSASPDAIAAARVVIYHVLDAR
jgi:hypothetical protein